MYRDPEVFDDNDYVGWPSPGSMRPPCEQDHGGSAPVGGLIKLVQLLIRWKAFNLDNLLTT